MVKTICCRSDGETVELTATLEQLDLICEAVDQLLAQDDAD
jgi:hypothetical protein